MIPEKNLIYLLKHPEKLLQFISCFDDLQKIISFYPIYTEALIHLSLTNLLAFEKLIANNKDLMDFIVLAPTRNEELLKAIQLTGGLQRLITTTLELCETHIHFPLQVEEIVQGLLNNNKKFKRLIRENNDFVVIAKLFPNYKNELMQKLLREPKTFKRLIDCTNDYVNIAKEFPTYENDLISKLIKDQKESKRIIFCIDDFLAIAKLSPKHAEALIHILMENPEEFRRLETNATQLLAAIKQLPQYAEALFQKLMDEDNKISICTTASLLDIADHFSHHKEKIIHFIESIPADKNLTTTLKDKNRIKAIKNEIRISKLNLFHASHVLGQSARRRYLFFQIPPHEISGSSKEMEKLPSEILIKIATQTGDINIHPEEQAKKIVYEHFDKRRKLGTS